MELSLDSMLAWLPLLSEHYPEAAQRLQRRIEHMRENQLNSWRVITVKTPNPCDECRRPIRQGMRAWWFPGSKGLTCTVCRPEQGGEPHYSATGPQRPQERRERPREAPAQPRPRMLPPVAFGPETQRSLIAAVLFIGARVAADLGETIAAKELALRGARLIPQTPEREERDMGAPQDFSHSDYSDDSYRE